jgi:uncharacterized protein (TIGR03067 family)
VLGLIGAGGMGAVFKARQPKLNRLVALKILPESLGLDPLFAERFAREGQLLARLSHPNIVTIHDFGEAGGFYYLLMEYLDGVNLREAMGANRFTAAQALAIVPKICEALQFAHDEGVLHRDIKPENILLDSKGRVKLADFGIAKLVGESESVAGATGPGPNTSLSLTKAQGTLGTPEYMAPEQRDTPTEVDHRADIYSLGVVFYELLTGELPMASFAPPSTKSSADKRIDAIVQQALEKDPEKRQQTAGEVKTQVETVSENIEVTARREDTNEGSRPSAMARLALGLLLGAIIVPLALLAFHRLNGGGLTLTSVLFLLAMTFGYLSRTERLGRICALAGIILPTLTVLVTAAVLLGDEWLARYVNLRNKPSSLVVVAENLELSRRALLEGEWKIASQMTSGRDTSSEVAGTRLVVRGEQIRQTLPDGAERTLKCLIRPEAKPMEIDLETAPEENENLEPAVAQRRLGILRLEGDRLIMAFNLSDPLRRPRGYVSQAGNSIEVTTLQRVRPLSFGNTNSR